jgi:predicted DNA-binding protein with PD1-like motif
MRSLEVEGGHLLRFEAGERLPGGLVAFCDERGIRAATAEGLGALADVELGYYDLERREYDRTVLPGSWELLSLFADVATWEDELFAHTHVVLSGPDFEARGGHLFDGTVSVTAEIRLWPIDRPLRRRMDDRFRLHFLDI